MGPRIRHEVVDFISQETTPIIYIIGSSGSEQHDDDLILYFRKLCSMKKNLMASFALLPILAVGISTAQAAAPTAELKVTGTLTVPSCTVTSANDGVYEIGKISATMVKPAANTPLETMSKTWTITCDAETYLNFKPVDNRADTASLAAAANFGLGSVNTTGKIGYYTVAMKNATVDGASSSVFSSATSSITSTTATNISTANRSGWSAGTLQKSGKVFTADLDVTPNLASSAMMNGPVTEDSDIDGSLTLNFAYGI